MSNIKEEPLLIRTVRELAAEKPNFLYKSKNDNRCYYLSQGSQYPGCIFGQALLKMGYTSDDLAKFDDDLGVDIENVCKALDIYLTAEERDWCSIVQTGQDNGDTWRKAIEYADEEKEYLNENN